MMRFANMAFGCWINDGFRPQSRDLQTRVRAYDDGTSHVHFAILICQPQAAVALALAISASLYLYARKTRLFSPVGPSPK
jgi:hypothetical protein